MIKTTTLFLLMITINGISQPMGAERSISFENVRSLTEINESNLADAYPWISSDGLRVYYTKEFADGEELVFTQRADYESDFGVPIVLPTGVSDITSCWLSQNELMVYITNRSHLYRLTRSSRDSDFGPPETINLDGSPSYSFLTGPSLDGAQDELFISLMINHKEGVKLAKFKRTSDNAFSFEKFITLPNHEIPHLGQLSKDGGSLCVTIRDSENRFTKFYKLSRASAKESFNVKTMHEIVGFTSYSGLISQPSVSANMEWLVGVHSSGGLWQHNDLFIAKRESYTAPIHESSAHKIMAYPNPTTGTIHIACGEANVRVAVFNIMGQQIDDFRSSSALVNYHISNQGVYMIQVFTAHGVQSQKLVVSHL